MKNLLIAVSPLALLFFSAVSSSADSGCDENGCYVTATRSHNGATITYFGYAQYDGDEYSVPHSDAPGDGSFGGCGADEATITDALARAFGDLVEQLDGSVEHGALIVNTPVGLQVLGPFTSNSPRSIAGSEYLNALDNAGYEWADITALLHSHPAIAGSDSDNSRNRAPAWSPSDNGDYRILRYAQIRAEEQGANMSIWNSRISQYILGPDGTTREFPGIAVSDAVTDGGFDDAEAAAAMFEANDYSCGGN